MAQITLVLGSKGTDSRLGHAAIVVRRDDGKTTYAGLGPKTREVNAGVQLYAWREAGPHLVLLAPACVLRQRA